VSHLTFGGANAKFSTNIDENDYIVYLRLSLCETCLRLSIGSGSLNIIVRVSPSALILTSIVGLSASAVVGLPASGVVSLSPTTIVGLYHRDVVGMNPLSLRAAVFMSSAGLLEFR
jgi:hypothetical protein